MEQFKRSELIYGPDAMLRLKQVHVAIFGIGGVGGYVAESLARSGVGRFTLVDNDTIAESNINRQIVATVDTIGKLKVDVMKERILSINPKAIVETFNTFFLEENEKDFEFYNFDYVVDCVDTVKAKIALVKIADKNKVPVISCMGAGNKVNPMGFVVTDIYKTEMDPLAKVMRTELRKLGIRKLKVVYSREKPIKPVSHLQDENSKKREIPGSNAFVPSAAGLLIASEVVRDLTNDVARDVLKR